MTARMVLCTLALLGLCMVVPSQAAEPLTPFIRRDTMMSVAGAEAIAGRWDEKLLNQEFLPPSTARYCALPRGNGSECDKLYMSYTVDGHTVDVCHFAWMSVLTYELKDDESQAAGTLEGLTAYVRKVFKVPSDFALRAKELKGDFSERNHIICAGEYIGPWDSPGITWLACLAKSDRIIFKVVNTQMSASSVGDMTEESNRYWFSGSGNRDWSKTALVSEDETDADRYRVPGALADDTRSLLQDILKAEARWDARQHFVNVQHDNAQPEIALSYQLAKASTITVTRTDESLKIRVEPNGIEDLGLFVKPDANADLWMLDAIFRFAYTVHADGPGRTLLIEDGPARLGQHATVERAGNSIIVTFKLLGQ